MLVDPEYSDANPSQVSVIRYLSYGAWDTSFGDGGAATVTADTSFTPTAMAIQPDGKVIVAGTESSDSGDVAEMRIFRLNTDGSVDTSFGDGGSIEASLGTGTLLTPQVLDKVAGVSVMPNGDILVGGSTVTYALPTSTVQAVYGAEQFAIARLTPDGQLDPGYGPGGINRALVESAADVELYANRDGIIPGPFDPFDLGLLLRCSFSARSDGSAVMTDKAGTVVSFDPPGNVVYNVQLLSDGVAIPGSGVVTLPDGRAVILGSGEGGSTLASELAAGLSITPIAADGTVGDSMTTNDLKPADSSVNGYPLAAIGVAQNGEIIVGAGVASGSEYEAIQLGQGTASAVQGGAFANGTTNSLATSADGTLNLAYYDSAAHDLKYVHRLVNGLWGDPITVDAKEGAGGYLSLAVDPVTGTMVCIAYYDKKSHSLKLATSTNGGSSFSTQLIDGSGDVGEYPSIYINGDDLVSIAYYDQTGHDLRFATENKKHRFSISTIDSSGNVGRDAVLVPARDSGRLSVAYVDSTRGEIKWAAQDADGLWAIKVAAQAPGGVEGLSMDYTNTDDPAIAFYDIASGALKLAVFPYQGTAFRTSTVAAGPGQVTGLVPFNEDADPLIYAYDAAANNVELFSNPVTTPGLETAVVTNGGSYLSLAYAFNEPLLAAYVDSNTGDLVVRPLPIEGSYDNDS